MTAVTDGKEDELMKRKLSALVMTIILVLSCIPQVYADMNYTVYDLTFEEETGGFKSDGALLSTSAAKSGEKSLYIKKYDGEENAPKLTMSYLNRNSQSLISVWVKPDGASEAAFKLKVKTNEGGKEKTYTLDTVKASGQAWVKLSGELFIRYRNVYDAPELTIESTNGGFYIDDFKVMSDRASLNTSTPIEEISYNGNMKMRFAFETGTIEKFLTEGIAAYNFVAPEYEVTNEVPAHSGKYCLKVSDRLEHSELLALEFPNLPKDAKIKVSCWVRNANGVEKQKYILQGVIPVNEGKKWPWLSDYCTAEKDEWIKLEGVLDLTGYTTVGNPQIRFTTTNESSVDYYIDDIVVEGNFAGEFYDDMNYTPPVHDDTISDTPSVIRPIVTPIQENVPSIKDVYREYFKIGTAVTQDMVIAPRYSALIKKHCNTAVSESGLKMQNIIKNPKNKTNYNFKIGDEFMEFCRRNGIEDIVGHCLIWDLTAAIPYLKDENNKWLDRDTNLKFMQEYIDRIIKHFEGDGNPSEYLKGVDYSNWHLNAWDVVNEAASHETEDGYKRSGGSWINGIGKDYVDYAYEYATKTCEDNGYDITLRYNDYGEETPKKREAVYNLVKGLLDRGVNVQSLGIQSHYKTNTSSTTIRRAIEKYASLGLPMDITEIDIGAYTADEIAKKDKKYENGVTKEAEFTQATLYNELFELYKEYSDSIGRVVTWTLSDRAAYLNYTKYIKKEYAGIFDRDYQVKPQFWAIVDSEKYFKEIMKEDTSKLRVTLDSKNIEFESDSSCFTENGTIYADAEEILNILNVRYVNKNGRISAIRSGNLVEVTPGSDNINSGFEMKKISAPVTERDGRIYVPIIDMCNELGFGTSYNEMRNMVNISSDQMGETLI